MWLLKQKKQSYNNLESLLDFPYISENRYVNANSVELNETENELILSIALPGVLKKDIKLEFLEGYFLVEANPTFAKEAERIKSNQFSEVATVDYQRQFYVGDINQKSITAELNHGILKVVFPKKEDKKAQVINIT